MEIWIRLIVGPKLKLRCRCLATFFCDAVFVIFFCGMLRCGQSPNAPLTVTDGDEFSVPCLSRYS